MFEAQCPSCQATYQVDERRVPPSGLKMRCPKCGESFQVIAPGPTDPPVLGAALGLGAARPESSEERSRHRPTMLGVPPQAAPPPAEATGDRPRGTRKTMMGVAPAADHLELADLDEEGGQPPDSLDLDLPMPVPDRNDLDLPMPVKQPESSQIDLPSLAPSGASSAPPDSDEMDLLALGPDLPELPSVPGSSRPVSSRTDAELDLPVMGVSRPAVPRASTKKRAPVHEGPPSLLPRVDLPSPAPAALPELTDDLPDLEPHLPLPGGPLPTRPGSAGAPSAPMAPSTVRGAPESLDASALTSDAPPSWGEVGDFGDELGASAEDIFGHGPPPAPKSVPPSQAYAAPSQERFGGLDDTAEFDAFPTDEGGDAPAGSQAAGYGDIALEGGGGDFDLGADVERPNASEASAQPRGPAAAASAAVERPQPAASGSEKLDRRKKRRKTSGLSKGTRIAIAAVLLMAVAGGALASLVPGVGPYGVYFVIDSVRAKEYHANLEADIRVAQQYLAEDTSGAFERAFYQVESGRMTAPRFQPRAAYAAHLGFVHQLRFGEDSDVSARAEVLYGELVELQSTAQFMDLARMAREATTGKPEVTLAQADQMLARGADYAAVVGEAALRAKDHNIAEKAWGALLRQRDTARAHYGMARALSLAGRPEEQVMEHVSKVLARNAEHIGGHLIQAQYFLKQRDKDDQVLLALEPILSKKKGPSDGERLEAHAILGELHLRQGRVKKAEDSFSQALVLDPSNARAQHGLAQVFFQSGRYSEALTRFEGALRAAPGDLAASLGVVRSKLALEQLDDAVKLLDPLSAQYPNSAAVAYWVGRGKEAVGEKDAAQRAYEQATKTDDSVPELVLAYIALTRLLGQKGHFEEANQVIQQAEKRFPRDPAVYQALGQLAANGGSYEDAIRHYEKAILLDPNNLGLKFERGVALRQARRFEEAAAVFDAVEKESPGYPGLALERGNLFEASGESAKALGAYEAALAAAPEDVDLKLRVACAKAGAGQSKDALVLLEPIVQERQDSAEVNFCMGLAHLNAQDAHEARPFLQRAAARDPSRAKYHLYVGWVALEMNDLSLANVSLEKAIELDQTLADAYWKRGELRVRRKAVRDALTDLDKALELSPSRYEAHAQKGLAFIELGREQEALASFEQAVQGDGIHPYWRYKFGELLLANRRTEDAKQQLQQAVLQGQEQNKDAVWLPNAHRLLAMTLGDQREAIAHWQAYIEAKKGDPRDPYLREAIQAVNRIAQSKGIH